MSACMVELARRNHHKYDIERVSRVPSTRSRGPAGSTRCANAIDARPVTSTSQFERVRPGHVHTRTVPVKILQSERVTSYIERVGSRFATNARHPTPASVASRASMISIQIPEDGLRASFVITPGRVLPFRSFRRAGSIARAASPSSLFVAPRAPVALPARRRAPIVHHRPSPIVAHRRPSPPRTWIRRPDSPWSSLGRSVARRPRRRPSACFSARPFFPVPGRPSRRRHRRAWAGARVCGGPRARRVGFGAVLGRRTPRGPVPIYTVSPYDVNPSPIPSILNPTSRSLRACRFSTHPPSSVEASQRRGFRLTRDESWWRVILHSKSSLSSDVRFSRDSECQFCVSGWVIFVFEVREPSFLCDFQ